jgi:hypothetical protein
MLINKIIMRLVKPSLQEKKKKKDLATLVFGAFLAQKNAPNDLAMLY